MRLQQRLFLSAVVILGTFTGFGLDSGESVQAQEPGWYPYVIARGQDREWIEATPIVERMNRPLHFYGNTIRRSYFRGSPLLMPRDVVATVRTVVTAPRGARRR